MTGQTAAEIIIARANAEKPNMALTAWKGSIVRKQDIFTAKNYLSEDEIDTLNRLVVIFLETAELRAKNKVDITMSYWRENVDKIIAFNDRQVLVGSGTVSHSDMGQKVREVYKQFDAKRKNHEALMADKEDLEEIEKQVKLRINK